MKIYNKVVLKLQDDGSWKTIEEDSYEWDGPVALCDGGGGSGGSESSGEWGSQQFAPIQIGASSPVKALGKAKYKEMVQGMYGIMRAYVKKSFFDNTDYLASQYEKTKEAEGKISNYTQKIDQIADQLAVSFGTMVKPDELKTFPLDSFIESNLKEIYNNAKGVFEGSLDLDRNEIKTIVESNSSTLMSGFRQQRRELQQTLQQRGMDPNSAAGKEALNNLETQISKTKAGVGRDVLSTELQNRAGRKMQALGTMGATTGQAQSYVSDQANRWMNQYAQKMQASQLQLQGLLGSAGLAQQGIGNTLTQYQLNKENMMLPMNILSNNIMPFLSEIGRQDISAHAGAGTSWGTQQSSTTNPSAFSQSFGAGLGQGLGTAAAALPFVLI